MLTVIQVPPCLQTPKREAWVNGLELLFSPHQMHDLSLSSQLRLANHHFTYNCSFLSACLPICVFLGLSACQSVCLLVCLPACLSVRLSACASVCLSLSVCLAGWLSVRLSTRLPMHYKAACGAGVDGGSPGTDKGGTPGLPAALPPPAPG